MHIVTPTLLLVVYRLQAYRVLVGTLKEERVNKSMATATKHVAQRLRKMKIKCHVVILLQKPSWGFRFVISQRSLIIFSFTWALCCCIFFIIHCPFLDACPYPKTFIYVDNMHEFNKSVVVLFGLQEVLMGKAEYFESFKQNADEFICSVLPGISHPQVQYSRGNIKPYFANIKAYHTFFPTSRDLLLSLPPKSKMYRINQ